VERKKDYDPGEMAELTANAITVLEKRYLWRDDSGKIIETPDQLFRRVAKAIALAEKKNRRKWEERFHAMMAGRRFMPNSPTLMNAGKKRGQLSACFVLPVGDSLEEIFETLKQAAKIHQSGGGTGFNFSKLRVRGSVVRSTHGVASGPVSFMRIYDTATETIKQGGARRGANMGILRVDHPDILEFIDCKRDQHSILNFNISVAATNEFMAAVRANGEFGLRSPRAGTVVRNVKAREIFDRIVRSAWECGDPGLVFIDRINQFNPTPRLGAIESTNPCSEQPLLPYESCNLGSLNLGLYVKEGGFNWGALRDDVWTATRFLDDVIDVNVFPVEDCARITLKNRKIGLGVMGFADALLMLGLPYDTPAAVELGERVMSFVDREARAASAALAKEKGAFANWKGSLWQKLGYPPLRNSTVSTIAPTGTISMIVGASSGIEPIFSGVFYRNVLSGARLLEIHPAVEAAFRSKGVDPRGATEERIAAVLGAAWRPAQAIAVGDHVRMQAAFQRHSDSGVSKTINLPEQATQGDVAAAYLHAHALGCKGITVYRDKSRPSQVLERSQFGAEVDDACPSC
jgi:ribonucleoside-diphosphate reductase alpha chain